jgi:hypothetical protein
MSKIGGFLSWLLGVIGSYTFALSLDHRLIFGNWGAPNNDGCMWLFAIGSAIVLVGIVILVFDDEK